MPSLRELQLGFIEHLLGRSRPEFLAHIDDGRFGAERHLQVYRHNVLMTLTEALTAAFPVVQRLVGTGFFAYVADAFIRRAPPHSGNLHDFGNDFPSFLTAFGPAGELAYLPDVARLEWMYHEAYHAADAVPVQPDAFVAVRPVVYGQLRLRLHPSARLLASPYPILRIWQINQADSDTGDQVKLSEGPVRLLIIRRDTEVEIEPLDSGTHAFFDALMQGLPLGKAIESATAADPQFDLAAVLLNAVTAKTFVGIDAP